MNQFLGLEIGGTKLPMVVGDEPADRLVPSGLWPSDHAGVVVELQAIESDDSDWKLLTASILMPASASALHSEGRRRAPASRRS